ASDDAKPGRNNVLVLGNAVWKKYFHADRGIVGRQVTINGDPYTVIGVLGLGVDFPGHAEAQEIYSPLLNDDKNLMDRGSAALSPFGLLRPGATLEQARAE